MDDDLLTCNCECVCVCVCVCACVLCRVCEYVIYMYYAFMNLCGYDATFMYIVCICGVCWYCICVKLFVCMHVHVHMV